MKHKHPTVNHLPRDSQWDIFMSRANTSALHIIAPPSNFFTAWHPANDSTLNIITLPEHSIARKAARLIATLAGDLYLKLTRVNFKCKFRRKITTQKIWKTARKKATPERTLLSVPGLVH